MAAALLLARLLLAVVFVVAGLSKLADRAGTREAVRDFGVPGRLARPLAVLLPSAELAVAATLVLPTSAWWGAAGALALLLLFSAGIGLMLARGRRPACHCFGQLASAPIGWSTLARKGALAAVAGFVLWQGRADAGPSVIAWAGDLSRAERLALIIGALAIGLGAALLWLLLQLLAQNGRLLERVEALEARLPASSASPARSGDSVVAPLPAGLPVGVPAPAFQLAGPDGVSRSLDDLRAAGKPVLLVFSDPTCGPCAALLPDLGRWQRELANSVTLALISRGTPAANRAASTEHRLTHVLIQAEGEVAGAYQASGTPAMVLVHPDGTIGSPLARGAEEIRALVARTMTQPTAGPPAPSPPSPATRARANGQDSRPCPQCGRYHGGDTGSGATPPPAVQLGEAAPPLALLDLTGASVSLAAFRGSPTLILFWSPDCGFCQELLPDVKAWEDQLRTGGSKLLVISAGSVEANRSLGLRSPVVLESSFQAGFAFGATGTPSAVLVDADGRIASSVAVGAPAVRALARGTVA